MLFLKTVSILVGLKETKDSLIFGDEEYTNIPSSITKLSYDNVNWNRMLKYETSDLGKDIIRFSYYKAIYDLYLDTDKYELVVLAKNTFDEFVSKQNKFKKEFIPNLIKAINFNKEELDYLLPKELFDKYLVEQVSEYPKHINNYAVDKAFNNKGNKYKFKNLYQLDDHNETVETKNGQFIHHVDIKKLGLDVNLANSKFVNLDTGTIYLNGYVSINNDKVYLNIRFEGKKLINRLNSKIIELTNGSN